MKKMLFFAVLFVFSTFLPVAMLHAGETKTQDESSISTNSGNESPKIDIFDENLELSAIDRIEIGVESREIRALQRVDGDFVEVVYPAATASPKNAHGLPYDKIGVIWKLVFNPSWTPTKNIREEHLKKTGRNLPKITPPGNDNPLGIVKLFIAYDGYNSNLGIHHTNEPKSIGKRVSHGCNRLSWDDSLEMATLILEQNGYDAEEIINQARKNPKKTIAINIANRPEVVYRRK